MSTTHEARDRGGRGGLDRARDRGGRGGLDRARDRGGGGLDRARDRGGGGLDRARDRGGGGLDRARDRGGFYLDGDPALGAVVVRSTLLDRVPGVTHGFATRRGGARGGGGGVGGELDFGARASAAARRENRRRLALRLGVEPGRVFTVRQVHGARIVDVEAVARREAVAAQEADGVISQLAATAVGVLTADCVPVLLAERRGRAVAAVHAGWRGLAAGILGAAVARFEELGVAPRDLVAAIGPCIGVEAYEVGEEVAEAFADLDEREDERGDEREAGGEAGGEADDSVVRRVGRAKPHVALAAAAARLLARAGVRQVARSEHCTAREEALFHSHRRDASFGRQLSVIGRLCSSPGR